MSEVVLRVENLSKKFCISLKRSLFYGLIDAVKSAFGVEVKNDLRAGEFWALQGISFELKKGETLGIIGSNGSGKSTLLRMITGIFPPDTGRVSVKGRVGSLIAVGAGFHPHMTGRENIYLNGTILGMSKEELESKIEEIINFAEIGEFIDAPVSTYSSGMRVKLGFSIAVNLKPEILILDEVLSVGDEAFKMKSMKRVSGMMSNTATIFVSHSMRDIYRLCTHVMWLKEGKIVQLGAPGEVVNNYLEESLSKASVDEHVISSQSSISDIHLDVYEYYETGGKIDGVLSFNSAESIQDVIFIYSLLNMRNEILVEENTNNIKCELRPGVGQIGFKINNTNLMPGTYYIVIKVKSRFGFNILEIRSKSFVIKNSDPCFIRTGGVFREKIEWIYE